MAFEYGYISECVAFADKDSNPNEVNIAWLIPQYIIITVAEVMVSVTGLEFAYNQAPKSMKAVIQSFWLLTTCFGNIIDIFLVAAKMGNNQVLLTVNNGDKANIANVHLL